MGKAFRQARAAQRAAGEASTALALEFASYKKAVTVVLGILIFGTYLLTLYPTLPGGDSEELITVACTMGIAHPPGYPLFTLLGNLFTWIPFGTIAWRVNLLSAVCDTAAALILYESVFLWSGNLWAGVLTAGLFAFSPLVWSYAIAAEVFGLNHLVIAALLYFSIRYFRSRDLKFVRWFSFILGLGLANHQTVIFYGAPLILWILWNGRRELLNLSELSKLVLLTSLGMFPYFYLWLASNHSPMATWGDTSTGSGLLRHILRSDYGTFQLGSGNQEAELGKGLLRYASELFRQVLFVGVPLAVWGLRGRLRKEGWSGLALVTLGSFILYTLVFHSLANIPLEDRVFLSVLSRFWQQSNLLVCVWAGLGLAELGGRRIKVVAALACSILALQLGLNFRLLNQSGNHNFENYGKQILSALPPRALLLSVGDLDTYSTRYLHLCEGARPDVKILDRAMMAYDWNKRLVAQKYPDIVYPGAHLHYPGEPAPGFELRQFLDENLKRFPVYMSVPPSFEDRGWESAYFGWPFGIVNRVVPRKESIDVRKYVEESSRISPPLSRTPPQYRLESTWEDYLWERYWDIDHRRAVALLRYAQDHWGENDSLVALRLSASLLEGVAEKKPEPAEHIYKNLSVVYDHLRKLDSSVEKRLHEVWRKYLAVATGPDPDIPYIRKQLSESRY
jgi:hypothetical protein